MADIELVIKIDEEYLELIRKSVEVDCVAPPYFVVQNLWENVLKATPLPKRHGRLIDADALADGMEDDYEFCEAVNATPTIIEADGESEVKSND